MRKTGLLGLILMAFALIIAVSCSLPSYPDGGLHLVQTQPGNTVKAQLKWLRDYAQSNGNYIVVARENEPRIPGFNDFGISYGERENITVTIQSAANIPRQTLRLLDEGVILNVGANNTLILRNINLQASADEWWDDPIVKVYGGTLKMIDSVISGNPYGRGVEVTAEGTLIMGRGAVIYNNNGGVAATQGSRMYMYENAAVRNNVFTNGSESQRPGGGVALYGNSVLTMRGGSIIENNKTESSGGGVSVVNGSHAFMYDNAVIRDNYAMGSLGGGGVFFSTNSTLNMHNNNVHISRNKVLGSYGGGGVSNNTAGNARLNISGGTIHGNDAAPNLANVAAFSAAMFIEGGIRIGNYCSIGGFVYRYNLTGNMNEHTFRVIYGVQQ